METENISSRNIRSLLILMVLCGSLVNGAFTVEQDTWIAVLFMGILFLPVLLVYSRICSLFPEKNLYDIITDVFGKIAGFIIILFMSSYALIVTALQLRNFTEFTVVIELQNTPSIPIMIVLILPVVYLAKQGLQVLGRWSLIICIIITANIGLTIIFALNVIDPSHILPIFDHKFSNIISDAFTIGSIAVGEVVIVMVMLGSLKKGKSPYGVYLPGVLIGLALFALIILRNISILGTDMEQAAKFSTYMAVRIIDLGNFFERIESSISFIYILLGITKMTIFLSATTMGVARLFKVSDYKRFLLPVSLLVLGISTMVFNNVFEMYELVWIYHYFALPFQVFIPIIIWIGAEIKCRKCLKTVKSQ